MQSSNSTKRMTGPKNELAAARARVGFVSILSSYSSSLPPPNAAGRQPVCIYIDVQMWYDIINR